METPLQGEACPSPPAAALCPTKNEVPVTLTITKRFYTSSLFVCENT